MIITEATVICIIILFITLFGMLCKVYKRLESIEEDLMDLETRQRNMLSKQDYMHNSIYYVSSQLEDIAGKID